MALASISFHLLRKQGRKRYQVICRVSLGYRVMHEGKTKYKPIQITTGLCIAPDEWDQATQRACTRADKARGLKACIDHAYINSTLERIYDRCRLITEDIRVQEFDGRNVEPQQAKEMLLTDPVLGRLRGAAADHTQQAGVIEWLTRYNEGEATTTEGTKASRRNTLKHLREYHEATAPGRPLLWKDLGTVYLEAFRGWLIATKELGNATVNKQMNTVRTFLEWGRGAGLASEPVKITKLKEDQGGKIYLKPQEIDALCALELEGREQATRDWFVIACGTGLRVGDLLSLTRANLIPPQDASKPYTITHRQGKTKKQITIPVVVPQAVAVFERLGWQFPTQIPATHLNRMIKDIAQRAGLNAPTEDLYPDGRPKLQHEAITMHTGRRSFATNAYSAGIPLEVIRTLTGHSDNKTLEIYLRQTNEEKRTQFVERYTK